MRLLSVQTVKNATFDQSLMHLPNNQTAHDPNAPSNWLATALLALCPDVRADKPITAVSDPAVGPHAIRLAIDHMPLCGPGRPACGVDLDTQQSIMTPPLRSATTDRFQGRRSRRLDVIPYLPFSIQAPRTLLVRNRRGGSFALGPLLPFSAPGLLLHRASYHRTRPTDD